MTFKEVETPALGRYDAIRSTFDKFHEGTFRGTTTLGAFCGETQVALLFVQSHLLPEPEIKVLPRWRKDADAKQKASMLSGFVSRFNPRHQLQLSFDFVYLFKDELSVVFAELSKVGMKPCMRSPDDDVMLPMRKRWGEKVFFSNLDVREELERKPWPVRATERLFKRRVPQAGYLAQ